METAVTEPQRMGRVVAGIQARMSSSRLPGKMLADVGGKPLFYRVVERLRACRNVDEVVILTSTEPSDDALAEAAADHGVDCRRGPLQDVFALALERLRAWAPA